MDNIGKKLILDFNNQFGNLLWSHDLNYIINNDDLQNAHQIININIFENKLQKIPFVVENYTNQRGKGSFRAGYLAQKNKYKQDIKFITYGFNVQKIYNRNDKIFMKKIDENEKFFIEDIDEEPTENRNLLSSEYAKIIYDHI